MNGNEYIILSTLLHEFKQKHITHTHAYIDWIYYSQIIPLSLNPIPCLFLACLCVCVCEIATHNLGCGQEKVLHLPWATALYF